MQERRSYCKKLSQLFQAGKLDAAGLTGRRSLADTSSTNVQPILDYILHHAIGDERPYLRVKIFGKELLGLLDSGASRTIMGSSGWKLIQNLGIFIDSSTKSTCRVANGGTCESVGECLIPFTVRDKSRIVSTLVVPDLPHTLILGSDFWRIMGIVPDLRHGECILQEEAQHFVL